MMAGCLFVTHFNVWLMQMEIFYQNVIYVIGLIFSLLFLLSVSIDYIKSRQDRILLGIKNSTSSKLIYITISLSISVIFLTASVGILLLHLQSGIDQSGNPTYFEPNKFGDFFGGTLGSLFSFLSFIAVVISSHLQAQQQNEILKLSENSKDEESFYLLLDRLSSTYDEKATREGLKIAQHYFKKRSDLSDTKKAEEFACAAQNALWINFRIFARLVYHIEHSSLPDKGRYFKILKAFMSPLQIGMYALIAKNNLMDEKDIVSIFKKKKFIGGSDLLDLEFTNFIDTLNENQKKST